VTGLPSPATVAPADPDVVARVIAALGGRANLAAIEAASTRVLITLRDAAKLDPRALQELPLRGVARPAPTSVHLVVGPDAEALLRGLNSSAVT
jgi:phosphotransferase system IIB component